MDDNVSIIMTICAIGFVLVSTIGISIYGSYHHNKMRYENFQETISELSDEQKCMHICGFQYPAYSYFDQYKFCLEKCDRISEREQKCVLAI